MRHLIFISTLLLFSSLLVNAIPPSEIEEINSADNSSRISTNQIVQDTFGSVARSDSFGIDDSLDKFEEEEILNGGNDNDKSKSVKDRTSKHRSERLVLTREDSDVDDSLYQFTALFFEHPLWLDNLDGFYQVAMGLLTKYQSRFGDHFRRVISTLYYPFENRQIGENSDRNVLSLQNSNVSTRPSAIETPLSSPSRILPIRLSTRNSGGTSNSGNAPYGFDTSPLSSREDYFVLYENVRFFMPYLDRVLKRKPADSPFSALANSNGSFDTNSLFVSVNNLLFDLRSISCSDLMRVLFLRDDVENDRSTTRRFHLFEKDNEKMIACRYWRIMSIKSILFKKYLLSEITTMPQTLLHYADTQTRFVFETPFKSSDMLARNIRPFRVETIGFNFHTGRILVRAMAAARYCLSLFNQVTTKAIENNSDLNTQTLTLIDRFFPISHLRSVHNIAFDALSKSKLILVNNPPDPNVAEGFLPYGMSLDRRIYLISRVLILNDFERNWRGLSFVDIVRRMLTLLVSLEDSIGIQNDCSLKRSLGLRIVYPMYTMMDPCSYVAASMNLLRSTDDIDFFAALPLDNIYDRGESLENFNVVASRPSSHEPWDFRKIFPGTDHYDYTYSYMELRTIRECDYDNLSSTKDGRIDYVDLAKSFHWDDSEVMSNFTISDFDADYSRIQRYFANQTDLYEYIRASTVAEVHCDQFAFTHKIELLPSLKQYYLPVKFMALHLNVLKSVINSVKEDWSWIFYDREDSAHIRLMGFGRVNREYLHSALEAAIKIIGHFGTLNGTFDSTTDPMYQQYPAILNSPTLSKSEMARLWPVLQRSSPIHVAPKPQLENIFERRNAVHLSRFNLILLPDSYSWIVTSERTRILDVIEIMLGFARSRLHIENEISF